MLEQEICHLLRKWNHTPHTAKVAKGLSKLDSPCSLTGDTILQIALFCGTHQTTAKDYLQVAGMLINWSRSLEHE